jgi:hypothetical protein
MTLVPLRLVIGSMRLAAVIAFEDSLSDADFKIFDDWLNDLDPDEQAALHSYFNGERA